VKRQIFRVIYRIVLRLDLLHSLRSFFPLWSVSDRIYIGPVGPSASVHPEVLAYNHVVADAEISDRNLYEHLSHDNPWIVGYCFEALLARRSPLLKSLPTSLRSRTELVGMGFTCFFSKSPLCDYVVARLSHFDLHHDESLPG
jgi:hypothetical protein